MNKFQTIKPYYKFLLPAILLLSFLLGIGVTRAYFTHQTDPVMNVITYADSRLDARLTEPDWDGVTDYTYEEDGSITPVREKDPDPDKTYGEELADHIIPGMSIPKDPIITNTSTAYDEWAAIKLNFVYAQGHPRAGEPLTPADYNQVMDAIRIDYNIGTAADNWELISESGSHKEFYYRSALARGSKDAAGWKDGESTAPLFQSVDIPGSVNAEQMNALRDMGGFVIYLEGFVVQQDETELPVYSAFRDWGTAGGVIFAYTPSEESPVRVESPGIFAK